MTEVKHWLDSLSLDQYFQSFQYRGFTTLSKCALLCEHDLDLLGIFLPGHRKRILQRLPRLTNSRTPRKAPPKPPRAFQLKTPKDRKKMASNHSLPPPPPCGGGDAVYANTEGEDIYKVPPSPKPVNQDEDGDDSIYMNYDTVHSRSSQLVNDNLPPPLPDKSNRKSSQPQGGQKTPPPQPKQPPVPAPRKRPVPKPRTSLNKNKIQTENVQTPTQHTPLQKKISITLPDVTTGESADYDSSDAESSGHPATSLPPDLHPVPLTFEANNNTIDSPKYEQVDQGAEGIDEDARAGSGARGNFYDPVFEPHFTAPASQSVHYSSPSPPLPVHADQNTYEECDMAATPSALDTPIPSNLGKQLEPTMLAGPPVAAVEEHVYEVALDVVASSRLSSVSSVASVHTRNSFRGTASPGDSVNTTSNDSLNQLVLLPTPDDSPDRDNKAESQNIYTQDPTSGPSTPTTSVTAVFSPAGTGQPPRRVTPPNISERVVTGSERPDEEMDNQSNEFIEGRSRPPTTGGPPSVGGQRESDTYEGVWNYGEKQLIEWEEGDSVGELRSESKPANLNASHDSSRVSMHMPPPKFAPPPLPPGVHAADDAPPPAVPPRNKPKMPGARSTSAPSPDNSADASRFSQIDPFQSFQRSFSGDDPFAKPDPFSSFDDSSKSSVAATSAASASYVSPNSSRDTFAEFDDFSAQRLRHETNLTSTPQNGACGHGDLRKEIDSCGSGAAETCGGGNPPRLSQDNVYSPYPMPMSSPESPGAAASPLYSKPSRKAPKPPPKKDLPYIYDHKRGTYVLEHEMSESYDRRVTVWESDDTLSDGGEFLRTTELEELPHKLRKQASIPIVPGVSKKNNSRSGYMYKHASKRSSKVVHMGVQWIKRWAVFENAEFKYYSTNKSTVSKRIIPVVTMLSIEHDIKNGENHPYRFTIITIDRKYTFALDDKDDLTIWASMLMLSIIEAEPFTTTLHDGGDMHSPDKEGFVKMDGIRGRRYLAVKKDVFCYYNTYSDYKVGSPIHRIDMKLASVKDLGKGNKLQMNTPFAQYNFIFDSPQESDDWKHAFEEAIAEGLGDDTILGAIYENSSNSFCADCGAPDPHWASINFAITLCKLCAGIHRTLSVPRSKIRSLRMDSKVWTPPLMNLMRAMGNDNSNNFWEWNPKEDDKIDSDSDMPKRKEYILNKYEKKMYCRFHPLHTDETALNEALCKQVMYDDVLETMHLVFSGADILYVSSQYSSNNETAIQNARKAKQPLQVEFLLQNGAEGTGKQPLSGSSFRSPPCEVTRGGVIMKGYLHKTGSNPRGEFLRRWVMLKCEKLDYYEQERSPLPKDSIEKKEMLSVTKTRDDRFEYSFEIGTRKYGGRVYQFGAESQEERTKWVVALAKVLAPVNSDTQDKIKDIDKGGIVFLKDGATSKWNGMWIHMKHKTMALYDADNHVFEELDLRKVRNISKVQVTERCLEAFDEGPPFVVDFPNRAFYIQGDTPKETENWFLALQEAVTLSTGLLEDQVLTQDDIPIVIEKCISFVAEHGMHLEGIYRLNGQHSKVTRLLSDFKNDARNVHLSRMEYNVHDVATTLKRFLRSLGDPLLTSNLYNKWIKSTTLEDNKAKLEWYNYLLGTLPEVNKNTLRKLIFHLHRVISNESENKMGVVNLASLFGPVCMKLDTDAQTDSGFGATNFEIAVFKDLLENTKELFDEFKAEEDSDKMKQKKIDEAIKKLEELQKNRQTAVPDHMQLYFTVHTGGDGEPKEYPCKVSPDMLAEEVLSYIQQSANLCSSTKWGLFEHICHDELVRPVHHREKVMDIIHRQTKWKSDLFTKESKLVVRQNYMYEKMELIFEPTNSLFSELRYTDQRRFKKVYFQFGQYKLSYQKDTKASHPTASWNAEDLLLYIGIQAKRSPPNKFGFSFIKHTDVPTGNFFGHAVCCNDEEELYRWAAGILHAQHPGGLEPGGQASGASISPGMPSRQPPPPPDTVELPTSRLGRNSVSKRSLMRRIFKKT